MLIQKLSILIKEEMDKEINYSLLNDGLRKKLYNILVYTVTLKSVD